MVTSGSVTGCLRSALSALPAFFWWAVYETHLNRGSGVLPGESPQVKEGSLHNDHVRAAGPVGSVYSMSAVTCDFTGSLVDGYDHQ
jgi:hypothetical protein